MATLLSACENGSSLTLKGECPLPVDPQACAVDYYEGLVNGDTKIIDDPVKKKCFTHWIDKIERQQELLDGFIQKHT